MHRVAQVSERKYIWISVALLALVWMNGRKPIYSFENGKRISMEHLEETPVGDLDYDFEESESDPEFCSSDTEGTPYPQQPIGWISPAETVSPGNLSLDPPLKPPIV